MPGKATRIGVRTLRAKDVDENAVAAFVVKPLDRRSEDAVVVQVRNFPSLAAAL
jgi:hypothetical protein